MRRIVLTFDWEAAPTSPGSRRVITVTFAEKDGRTMQTFHQTPFLNVDARDSHVSAGTSASTASRPMPKRSPGGDQR